MVHGVNTIEYVTEGGLHLTLKPVRPVLVEQGLMVLEQEWRKRGEPLDPPTYIIKNEVGEDLVFALSQKMVDAATDQEWLRLNGAKWDKYLSCQERFNAAKGERQQVLLLAMGVDVEVPEDGWREMQQWVGITIPTNPLDLKVHYLLTVAFSQADLAEVTVQLNSMSAGATSEQVAQFRGAIRRAMAERTRDAISSAIESVRALVDGASVPGDVDGETVGDLAAEPVGSAE